MKTDTNLLTEEGLRERLFCLKKEGAAKELILAYSSVLSTAQTIAKNDKNRQVQSSDIINAIEKEVKMATQSRDSGAPYNQEIFNISYELLPQKMSKEEIQIVVEVLIEDVNYSPSKKDLGRFMGILIKEYGAKLDKKLASEVLSEMLV